MTKPQNQQYDDLGTNGVEEAFGDGGGVSTELAPAYAVFPATPPEALPALRLLFPDARAEWYANALTAEGRTPDGLFVARDGTGQIHGAMLAQVLSGSLGVVWPPCAGSLEIEDSLMLVVSSWLQSQGVKVCQAFATAEELPTLAPLVRHGFMRTTELVFLRRNLDPDAPLPEPIHPIIFIPESPPFSEEFRTALLATHERSLDCPELNGERTPEEIIAGFADWTPGNEWYLAIDRDIVLGVVLFAAGVEPDVIELSYLGVVPLFRRAGFGSELLEFAIAAATLAKMTAITVSVDARNEPALRLYRRAGFVETHRHEVFLAGWSASEPA